MSFSHSMGLEAHIRAGVTAERVAKALAPLIDCWVAKGESRKFPIHGQVGAEFSFNEAERTLNCNTEGEVGYDYADLLQEVAWNLWEIVDKAGEIVLNDYETGNLEEARSYFPFGPSKRAIVAFQRAKAVGEAIERLKPHLKRSELKAVKKILLAK